MNLKAGQIVIDATFGGGGHAREILKQIGPDGLLVALDHDPEAIGRGKRLFENHSNISFHDENFRNVDRVLEVLNISSVDAVILDVGFSSDQLEDATRGFSFDRDGELDMRMNRREGITAGDLLNNLTKEELERIIWSYGDERWARRFAGAIVENRRKAPINSTGDLVRILERALPQKRHRGKRHSRFGFSKHPATRTFQALRIAVNDELGALREGLPKCWERLRRNGRLSVISFHSLEDRIVKQQFRTWYDRKEAAYVIKKPVGPSRLEIFENPKSRSAKLRSVEKVI